MFCGLDETYSNVAVVALGKKGLGYNELEEVDEGRENVRSAVSGVYPLSGKQFNCCSSYPLCTFVWSFSLGSTSFTKFSPQQFVKKPREFY